MGLALEGGGDFPRQGRDIAGLVLDRDDETETDTDADEGAVPPPDMVFSNSEPGAYTGTPLCNIGAGPT